MRYFKFSEPYEALLGADNPNEAIKSYKKNVCEEATDKEIEVTEIEHKEAVALVKDEILRDAQLYSEMQEFAIRMAEKQLSNKELFLIDASLV